MSFLPSCGSTCVELAYTKYMGVCNYNYPCICSNQDYINAFYSCIDPACSASDIQIWTEHAIEDCRALGGSWPSSAAAPASTAIVASVATLTSISTAVVILPSTVTLTGTAGSTTISDFFGAPAATSTNPNDGPATNALTTSTSAAGQVPISQSGNSGGLSTGAVVGIAVGAVAVVLLALIGGFFLWRRNRRQSRVNAQEVAPIDRYESTNGQGGNFEKMIVPTATVTSVKYPPELPNQPQFPDPRYLKVASVPELPQDQRVVPISPPQPLSPAPAYAEVAAVVPSEIDNASPRSVELATPHHSVAEVDSRAPSGPAIVPAISELEHPPFGIHHELPNSPEPPISTLASTHQSFAQSPRMLASAAVASSPAAGGEDEDLKSMKAELEQLRAKKARVQELQDIEMRERELSQRIVNRELGASRGGGGAAGPW